LKTSKFINKGKVEDLYQLAIQVAEHNSNQIETNRTNEDFIKWNSSLNETDTIDLLALISLLDSRNSSTSREIKALRESAIAHVTFKNAILISDTMERLDRTGMRLTLVSLALGIIGIVFTVLQFIR
jgi:hypothetical protein